MTKVAAEELLFSLLPPTTDIKNDHSMTTALEAVSLEASLNELRSAEISRQVASFMQSPNRKAALTGLLSAAQSLTSDERALLRSALSTTAAEHSPGK